MTGGGLGDTVSRCAAVATGTRRGVSRATGLAGMVSRATDWSEWDVDDASGVIGI